MNIQTEVETLNNEVISFINLDGILSPFNIYENSIHMNCGSSCRGNCNTGCSGTCDMSCYNKGFNSKY